MTEDSEQRVRAGVVLEGKYRLERELGSGGMGQVFLAEHETIERTVAIKVLHRELASDESVRRRFETEAKAIARLKHPNCVMLYEFGYSDEVEALFAVFEFVDGESLERWIGEQLPVADVIEVGRQVAAGMQHAHEQNIIHRDLKPENIMTVDSDGDPVLKVLDFGIARIAENDRETRLTQAGQMFGTPPYMSPEQVRAKLNITFATDIYAIGVILYELLEGELPFLGDTPISTVMMHLNDEVPPIEREEAPEELVDIIMKCLEKEAEDRFESCAALQDALEAVEWEEDPRRLATALEESKPGDEDSFGRSQALSPTVAASSEEGTEELDSETDQKEGEQGRAPTEAGTDQAESTDESGDPETTPTEEADTEESEEGTDADEMSAEEVANAETLTPQKTDGEELAREETRLVSDEPTVDEIGTGSLVERIRQRPVLGGVAVVMVVVLFGLAGLVLMLAGEDEKTPGADDPVAASVDENREDVEPRDSIEEPEQVEDGADDKSNEEDELPREQPTEEDDIDGGDDEEDADEVEDEERDDEKVADDTEEPETDEPESAPASDPAPAPSPSPTTHQDEEEVDDEAAEPAGPDPIDLRERRRRAQEDEDTDDEDKPEGIGLPDRD